MDQALASADASESNGSKDDIKNNATEDCVICLAPMTARAVAVPCNHCSFDFLCLAAWVREQARCPLCQCEISAIEFDWRSPDDYKRLSLDTSLSKEISMRSNHGGTRRHRIQHPPNESYLEEIDIAILRRRNVYRYQRYSLHIGSNSVSRFRNVSPDMIAASDRLQRKARTWIRRELRVFDHIKSGSSALASPWFSDSLNHAESLLQYIVEVIKITDIKGGRAEELLREHLGIHYTPLFLHELSSWLRSPYIHLEDWDGVIQYIRTSDNP